MPNPRGIEVLPPGLWYNHRLCHRCDTYIHWREVDAHVVAHKERDARLREREQARLARERVERLRSAKAAA